MNEIDSSEGNEIPVRPAGAVQRLGWPLAHLSLVSETIQSTSLDLGVLLGALCLKVAGAWLQLREGNCWQAPWPTIPASRTFPSLLNSA